MRIHGFAAALVVVVAVVGATTGTAGAVAATGVTTGNEAPLGDAGLDQHVRQGATVYLDGGGSRDPDGTIVRYEWTIETPNGSSVAPACATCVRTRFTARQSGVYAVTLTVTDDDGATSTDTLYVTVEADHATGPSVTLDGPETVGAGERATFDATFQAGSDDLRRVAWRVEGRTVESRSVRPNATGDSLSRSFASPGQYTVSVVVVDEAGRTATATRSLTVTRSRSRGDSNRSDPGDGQPTVGISGPDVVTSGTNATFTAVASDPDGHVVSYRWSGVDAASGPTAHRTIRGQPGSVVTVAVTVVDDDGNVATARTAVRIEGRPRNESSSMSVSLAGPRFVNSTDTGDFSARVRNDNAGNVGKYVYTWSVNGEVVASGPSSKFSYDFAQHPDENVTVTVTVTNAVGETVSDSTVVRVMRVEGAPDGSRGRAPAAADLTGRPVTGGSDSRAYRFGVEVDDTAGEKLTVVWRFSDGAKKVQRVTADGEPQQLWVTHRFTYTTSHRGNHVAGAPDTGGPKTIRSVVSVTVVDDGGRKAHTSGQFRVTAYPTDEDDGGDLSVVVLPDSSVRPGDTVTFRVQSVERVTVYGGDGDSAVHRSDPYTGGSDVEFSRTFQRAGTYTLQFVGGDGKQQTVTVEVVPYETYTVYRYQIWKKETWIRNQSTRPAGQDWQRMWIHDRIWAETGQTMRFVAGATPPRIEDSPQWQRAGRETRTKRIRYTTTARQRPSRAWTLAEEDVYRKRVRVSWGRFRGWKWVSYNRYERYGTKTTTYQYWERRRLVRVIYQWRKRVVIKEWKHSSSYPRGKGVIKETIEKNKYTCSNKQAKLYEENCK